MDFYKIPVKRQNGNQIKKSKLLIDKDMNRTTLAKKAGLSAYTITKLGKNENVSVAALQKICAALECDVGDIMEMIPEDKK